MYIKHILSIKNLNQAIIKLTNSTQHPWDWMDWEYEQELRAESRSRGLLLAHMIYREWFEIANEYRQEEPGTITGGTDWRSVIDKWSATDFYRWKLAETHMIGAEIRLRKHILFMIYAERHRQMKRRRDCYEVGCTHFVDH
jgi:hypothetical protein